MKIAFLIQCHKNPRQINRLIKALQHPSVEIFIHIDSKAKGIRECIVCGSDIHILPAEQCVSVFWGQFSQVQATLNMLKYASKCNQFDFYFLISGQDYPLKSIEYIVQYLREGKQYDYIDSHDISHFKKRNEIYYPLYFIGQSTDKKIMKTMYEYCTGGKNHTFSLFKRKIPNNIQAYFGSQWWCLNAETVSWLLHYLNENPEYMVFYKHSLCPDESFFHTLVMASPYVQYVRPFLHYLQFDIGKSSPKTLKVENLESLLSSDKLMARKFDIDVDEEVLRRIEQGWKS